MDWALVIALITAVAAMIQAHHANAAAVEANHVAKQELEAATKREPKLHFAISAELKADDNGDLVPDGYQLIVMNYGDAPSVLSRRRKREDIGDNHSIYSQSWNKDGKPLGHYTTAMSNSVVVMPEQVETLFIGSRSLASHIKKCAEESGYLFYFPLYDGFGERQINLRLTVKKEENLTVKIVNDIK